MSYFADYPIEAIQSADFVRRLILRDTNKNQRQLVGFTALFTIRAFSSTGPILLEATTENGMITITQGTGIIDIRIRSELIQRINPGQNVHELVLISEQGWRTVFMRGTFTIIPGIAVRRQGSTYYISDRDGVPVAGQNT